MSTWFSSVPALLGALLLAGCAASGSPSADSESTPAVGTGSGHCNADNVQDVIGQRASPAVQEDARRRSGAERVRLLHPGSVMTLEFNHQRLNLHVDDQAVIRQINCG